MPTILISPPTPGNPVPRDYVDAVKRAGGLPVRLTLPQMDLSEYYAYIKQQAKDADAVLLIGGPDIDPALYGESRLNGTVTINALRDKADLSLVNAALELGKPVLAVCRGVQVLCVALGGSLWQDIPAQMPEALIHSNPDPLAHEVSVKPDTLLRDILGTDSLTVSSRHHQAVKGIPEGMRACAVAPDGVVEALEFLDRRPAIGVQWHPETLAAQYPEHQKLFDWLVRKAAEAAR